MNFQNSVYQALDYTNGALYSVADSPSMVKKVADWLDKGEWLAAAKNAGAEKVFFVANNPVIIFARSSDDLSDKAGIFNRMWCLARPRILFLFAPGGLDVYDLAGKPFNLLNEQEYRKIENFALLLQVNKVTQELLNFHRDNVETGKIFGDERFGSLDNRADKALIRDLKFVRRELIHAGLSKEKIRFAHALIGRSIFIRYLEDRSILTSDYFHSIAGSKAGWRKILENPTEGDLSNTESLYARILSDKSLTYALFRKLARDFNGDMFPEIDSEENEIQQRHLTLIQNLLFGTTGIRQKLFFFSYRFDIVPLDLISSIYEEFYHGSVADDEKKAKIRQDGAYYTPSVLVEFVLSHILTEKALKNRPRVLDPACGSGIFLVEAFRRMVRYERHAKKRPLLFNDLKQILKDQISGIEVNPEAAGITAFSLYLSMLHYLDPPAIYQQLKAGNKLPNLVASTRTTDNHYHCILPGNTFDRDYIQSNVNWKRRFGDATFDIVIGNPPWGAPGKKADAESKKREAVLLAWCTQNGKPIGDKEPSQAFLWRALDFLKNSGNSGMLVSHGVLFKHNTTTQAFRTQWLENASLSEVYNFSHVRDAFFKGGISPFLAVFFRKAGNTGPVPYWTAKQSLMLKKSQAVVFSKYDVRVLRDQDLTESATWKINSWGRDGDDRFIRFLKQNKRLSDFVDRAKSGRGMEFSPAQKSSDIISNYKLCPIELFTRYKALSIVQFQNLPEKIYRIGTPTVYHGPRLLIKRGIEEKGNDKGLIVSRFESKPFCFTNAIHGIVLNSPAEWNYKLILGILWSSLSRYYFFMTSSNWGLWHHEIHLDDELLQLPVVIAENNPHTADVVAAVDKLRAYGPKVQTLFNPDGLSSAEIDTFRSRLEKELDEAIFNLYDLSIEQRDLVRDFCDVTLPFFYQPLNCNAATPAFTQKDVSWISEYVIIFCRCWNAYLPDGEEMRSQIHIGANDNLLAMELYPADKDDPWDLVPKRDTWNNILSQISGASRHPFHVSGMLLDSMVHIITKNGIIIIKRNEKRFWTRSMAREDANSTICKRMLDTMPDR